MRLLRAPGSWVLLALLATLAWADSASAQGLALGPFRVLPSLEFSIEYDDNILLTKDDKLDDIIFHIIPGVSLELPSRKYAIRLGYQADVLRYADEHKPDLSSLRSVLCGGAAVPESLMRAFEERHGVRVLQGWGMTETSPLAAVARPPEGAEGEEHWRNGKGCGCGGGDARVRNGDREGTG